MTDSDERISEAWDAADEPKKRRPGILSNFKSKPIQSANDEPKKRTQGRPKKGYTLTTATAKGVISRIFETVGRATGYADIWRLTPEETERLAGSSTVLFNALPEKMRTPAGENGTKFALIIAAAEFGFALRDTVGTRIVVMQMTKAQANDDTDYDNMSFEDLMRNATTPFPTAAAG